MTDMVIARSAARQVLRDWLAGAIDEAQVWRWALAARESGAPEDVLVRDVVDVLASLGGDLILREDAEVMLDGFANPPEEADLAVNMLWNHLDGVDLEARRREYADHPFYGPYCGDEL